MRVTGGCLLLLCWLFGGCSDPPAPPPTWIDPDTIPPEFDCAARAGQVVCEETWSARCDDRERAQDPENCQLQDEMCVPGVGCRVCAPNVTGCSENNEVFRCNAAGDAYEVIRTCDANTVCNASTGACFDLCADAEASSSYVGCDYWAVTTSNSLLDADFDPDTGQLMARVFEFEIVVANPQVVPAQITIQRPGAVPMITTIAPLAVRRIPLPWVEDLVGRGDPHTTHARGGAYHVRSSVPVTVYQFNPLEFRRSLFSVDVFSFTNDASLLLPTHVLTGSYTVMSRGTITIREEDVMSGESLTGILPGFVAITAVDTEDVSVTITSTAHTFASPSGDVPALLPGQSVTLLMSRGDVVQLLVAGQPGCAPSSPSTPTLRDTIRRYCNPEPGFDLTGTTIRATGRVSVIAGHDCAFVPFSTTACDHLEESMFPEEAWGRRVAIALARDRNAARNEPDLVRVVSGRDNNTVTFEPAIHSPITLARGESIELVADRDVVITGTEALMVAQFLVGQNYGEGGGNTGDPAMSLGIPSEQWRASYAFLTPSTYEEDYVSVIAPTGTRVLLDDVEITGWTPIESTGLSVARRSVSAGQHRMTGARPFGITVYGYARYTSYMYPGGLDLRVINGPE